MGVSPRCRLDLPLSQDHLNEIEISSTDPFGLPTQKSSSLWHTEESRCLSPLATSGEELRKGGLPICHVAREFAENLGILIHILGIKIAEL